MGPMTGATHDPAHRDPLPASAGEPSTAALRYGYAGLLPFVGGAVLVWLVRAELRAHVALALATYGAVIVSFLGGIHWGLAMGPAAGSPGRFGWAMVPPLVAWVGVLMPPSAGLVVMGVMLVVCYLADRRLYLSTGHARWLTLRFRLSAVAALSCFLAAAGVPTA